MQRDEAPELCGAPHPDNPNVTCHKLPGTHKLHRYHRTEWIDPPTDPPDER
jgi:hypothetical protein